MTANTFTEVSKIRLAESINGVPNITGSEDAVAQATGRQGPFYLPESGIDFGRVRSGFANALHMHQPLIPAGSPDLRVAPVISNLQYMRDFGSDEARYNAGVFAWCYKRLGEFIPQLIREGKQPRIMLDYSGCLLYGLRIMGLDDVIESLQQITSNPEYRRSVEWLGTAWSHAVAPSTPVQDFRRQVEAWQHHFAAIFGLEALSRVRGFSPPEMALPNHPDVAYEFVRTLKECGYRWVLLQEHSVERVEDGGPIREPHIPHILTARNSKGETQSIMAIVKTQGSDTKLVAQMQPYYEAKGLQRFSLAGKQVPPVSAQIADGENGGVMMNEFPAKYLEVMRESSASDTPPVNITEYLEYLDSLAYREQDFPAIQPVMQKRLWDRLQGRPGAALEPVIEELRKEDGRFQMEGGSWTNNLSWVKGYEEVLGPMEKVSALFAGKAQGVAASEPRFRNALYYLLMTQTSDFRYWGTGVWTDYGRELCRRAAEILQRDF